MKKIIVLGAGMIGRAMAIDLSEKFSVTAADINLKLLEELKQQKKSISILQLDVKNKAELFNVLKSFEIVLSAVPGFLGYSTLQTIIEAGKNVVDISFFSENAVDLDVLAKSKNVTAIVDCGVAPGMDNILLGHYNETMNISHFECLVGGLPKIKKMPFNYKAPFSPIDVIEEYTRPARYVENGNIIIKPAMSDVEHIEFEGIGTLEAFNSDGLRSIIYTLPHIKNKIEKTLRYPGHIEKIIALRDAGFFEKEKIEINGVLISPLEFTSKILFKEWKLGEKEQEQTIMRVTIEGEEKGVKKKIIYNLLEEYDTNTNTSSMARTTGYTATAAVNIIAENLFTEKGIFPPELIGKHENCFQFILNYLKERNVIYRKEEIKL